eukprot:TRINITY_DN80_c0_g1_i1.p1 TRINITY_DN80_c0_g1~~TRINITY_DN80_c0_g1_i1.p1  ORF type:complete len:238 (+),score=65.02 TRINITY_DN80_c0_g1_i1:56-769(+)
MDQLIIENIEDDQCILVNENDEMLGHISKYDAHLYPNLHLHRAFSFLLFDKEGKLLLQRRALTKYHFPGYWTNTVCSHPLFPDETDGLQGVYHALCRKTKQEIGLDVKDLSLFPIRRILYKTEKRVDSPNQNPKIDKLTNECVFEHNQSCLFGEYELDYIVIAQSTKTSEDIVLTPNSKEVCGLQWINWTELHDGLFDGNLTPWFEFIIEKVIPLVWNDKNNVELIAYDERIISFCK